jgi:acyl-CoA synthetase (NDP forming)
MTACPRPAEDGYFAARRLLEDGGLVFASARQVADLAEALSAAAEIGYPVALKAPALQHKSDVGGVVLGLDSDSSLEIAAREMWARHGPEPLSVESMMDLGRGVELLVGARRDARFGAIVLVGIGGVYTEIMGDVGAALAPVTEHQAGRLVADLRGAPLLLGARGRRPLDVAAAARAIRALSEVAASHPDVAEIEVNPLLVCEEGAYGLDARMALVPGGQAEPGS